MNKRLKWLLKVRVPFSILASTIVSLFAYYRFSLNPPLLYLIAVTFFFIWTFRDYRAWNEELEIIDMEDGFKDAEA